MPNYIWIGVRILTLPTELQNIGYKPKASSVPYFLCILFVMRRHMPSAARMLDYIFWYIDKGNNRTYNMWFWVVG